MINKLNSVFVLLILIIFFGCSSASVKNEKLKEEKFLVIRGINFAEAGKLEEALKNFKEAYKMNKENILTVRSIGLAYSKLGDIEQGEKYFLEALEIDSNDPETLYNLAVISFNKGEYEQAVNLIDRINVESYSFEIGRLKIFSLYELKEYKKCIDEVERVLSLSDNQVDMDIYSSYINSLENLGENSKIYPFLYNVYKKNRNNKNILFMIFEYYSKNKAYESAERILKEYGIENGFDYDVVIRLSKLEYALGNYLKALNYLDLLEREEKYDAEVLELKIELYEKLGMDDKAVELKKILNK